MATNKQQIQSWFERGLKDKKAFMIVVCDTFEWEDRPVYCNEKGFAEEFNKLQYMQKVVEVYNLSLNMKDQLSQRRVFNYPNSFKR